MEPQFVINVGCLNRYNLKAKDFFDMLSIDATKAMLANKDLNCPKCNRTQNDTYLIYYKYKDFKFGVDHDGKDADYSYERINLYLCICGCLYYTGSAPSVYTFSAEVVEKTDKDKKKNNK